MSALLLSGCGETPGDFSERSAKPLSPELLTLMQEKGTTPSSPVLIRAFKKEAEVQVWKMRTDGHYTLLKSYPICRWSGQLGPKTREGDRQVPEGFYRIGPSQMNPNSAYYLSFNVGYPNAYDRAHNYTGGSIMVHGVCSSAGCFSMTDKQIAEIYAIARESFNGGQREIQFQSYPFHMTAENFAKYRLDPNIAFWKELKTGNDNFEVTKQEVAVGVCNLHYVFNAQSSQPLDPNGPCPALRHDESVALAVNAKEAKDNAQVAQLVASGVRPVHTKYADGGQNEHFAHAQLDDVSRPDALTAGPVDMPLDQGKRYKAPTAKQLAAAEAKARAEETSAEKKAEAAHAYAYVDPPAAPQPKPQGFSFSMPGFGQKAPQPAGPTAVAQQQPQQQQGGGFFHLPSFGGSQTAQGPAPLTATQASAQDAAANTMGPAALLSNQTVTHTQAQQPTAVAAAPAPAAEPEETASTFTHSRPLPPTFVQSAAIRSGKPIITTSSDPHSGPTRAAEVESKHPKSKTAAAQSAEPSQATADAEAAKAAYAKSIAGEKPSSTASMPFGFSGFISGDK
ncbi:MAG TPA: murein L,D-transpeptidase family protein [Methylovirgula sp.]|nr:murein L,D-transpeptidase family protein [Methylovirgula sp.]